MSGVFSPVNACREIWTLGQAYAKARSDRVYLDEFRKSKKALLIQQAPPKGTVQDKESYAYAHEEYRQLLDGLRVAVENEQSAYFKLKSCELRIEVWRTEEANNRAQNYNQTT